MTCHGNVVGDFLSIHDLDTAYEIFCIGAVRAYHVLSADDLNVWDHDSIAEFPEAPMCEDVSVVEYHPYGCGLFREEILLAVVVEVPSCGKPPISFGLGLKFPYPFLVPIED